MLIDVMSDIHLEFNDSRFNFETLFDREDENTERPETLIIAGDIGVMYNSNEIQKIKNFFDIAKSKYKNIIYVLGNHDYWYLNFQDAVKTWENQVNITPLQNSSIVLNDIVFVGGTFWTNISNPVNQVDAELRIKDFRRIKSNGERFSAEFLNKENKLTREYISKIAEENKNKKIICVTHHAPLYRCATDYGSRIKDCYCNDTTDLILNHNNIKAWIHGHLHDAVSFDNQGVKIIANPRGYWNYDPKSFGWKVKTFSV